MAEVAQKFKVMRTELIQISQRLSEMQRQHEEHSKVLSTLSSLNGDRKCFRMINGILVERTVDDVRPVVKENMDGIEEVMKKLVESVERREREMKEFTDKNKHLFTQQ